MHLIGKHLRVVSLPQQMKAEYEIVYSRAFIMILRQKVAKKRA
jgi:hypothetical protein